MTIKRGAIYAGIIAALSVLWWGLHKRDGKMDQQISRPILMPSEAAKIILDPTHHTVVTVTRTGPVKQTYLPPHVVSVTVGQDGKVTVTSRAWGTEISPFIGLGFSDKARIVLGLDLIYWHRWEAGPYVGLGFGPVSCRVGVRVAYNVWNNTSLFLGVDNKGAPNGGLSVKF
jgi:hypothetical protein